MGIFGKSKFDKAFAPYEMEKQPSFWQGGDKFRGKDAIAGLLAVLGDAFANQAGMETGAVQGLGQGRLHARKLAEQERARAAVMERLVASGMDPNDAAVLAGDDAAVRQQIGRKYETPQAPPFVRNLEAWKQMTPEQQAEVAKMQSVLNPRWMMGADDVPYQMGPGGGMPPTITEDDWNAAGGGVGNGAGGFRPYRR